MIQYCSKTKCVPLNVGPENLVFRTVCFVFPPSFSRSYVDVSAFRVPLYEQYVIHSSSIYRATPDCNKMVDKLS